MCVYKRDYFSLQSFDNRVADGPFSVLSKTVYTGQCACLSEINIQSKLYKRAFIDLKFE